MTFGILNLVPYKTISTLGISTINKTNLDAFCEYLQTFLRLKKMLKNPALNVEKSNFPIKRDLFRPGDLNIFPWRATENIF